MKQKASITHINEQNIEKKCSNIIVFSDSLEEFEKENESTNNNNILHNKNSDIITKVKQNQKNKNKIKKIKYDPFVFHMIQNRNMKKWKSNIVFCVANYMTFEECLSLRLVCKLFNNGIKNKYTFLESDILFSSDEKIFEKIRKEYNIKNKNNKDKILFKRLFEENENDQNEKKYEIYKDFEFNKREVSNFSKKNMLSNMIYNKCFMSIKYKTKKGELFVPKNFII
jgi:hypothetical protein